MFLYVHRVSKEMLLLSKYLGFKFPSLKLVLESLTI